MGMVEQLATTGRCQHTFRLIPLFKLLFSSHCLAVAYLPD